jgi:hypothetical protein
MNKNRIIYYSQLRELFRKIPQESLSSEFMEKLMVEVKKEAARKKQAQKQAAALPLLAGISSMFLFPLLALYLCNLFMPGFSFSFADMHLRFNPDAAIVGLAILLLLIIDSLYRTHGRYFRA